MKRPLAVFCFAWFAVLFTLTQLPQATPLAAVLFCLTGLGAGAYLFKKDRRSVKVLVLAVISAAGLLACGRYAAAQVRVDIADGLITNEPVSIKARVDRVTWQQDSCRTEMTIYSANNKECALPVRAVVWNMDACEPGDEIEMTVELEPARVYDKSKGVLLYGYSWDEKVTLLDHQPSPLQLPMALQSRISAVLQVVIPGDAGRTASVICTGDKTALTDALSRSYQRAGLSHLLAVSGLHLSVVCGSLISMLPKRLRKTRFFIGSAVILFYVLFTGAQNSVLRAGCMLFLILLAQVCALRSDGATSLGIAVFLITLAQPFAAQNSGLLLSVSATAGVLWAADRWQLFLQEKKFGSGKLKRLLLSGCEMVVISLAAQIALIPAVIYSGLSLTVWALFAGLLTIPFLSFLIAFGLLGSALWCIPVLRPAGVTLLFFCRLFAGWQNRVAEFFAALPGGRLWLFGPVPLVCCLVFIAAVFISYGRLPAHRRWSTLAILLCLLLGGNVLLNENVVRAAMVGSNTRPTLVLMQGNTAAVFWQGGSNDTKRLENWLVSHGIENISLFCDISSKASQEPVLRQFIPDESVKPADGKDKEVTFSLFDDIMVTVSEQGTGRLLSAEVRGVRLGTAAGRTDLSENGRFDLFFAGQRAPEGLDCRMLVSNYQNYDWALEYQKMTHVKTCDDPLFSLWADRWYLIEKEAE